MIYRGVVTAADSRGVFVRVSALSAVSSFGPLQAPYGVGPFEVGDSVVVADAGDGWAPDLMVLGWFGTTPTPRVPPAPYWNDLRVSLGTGRPNTSPPTFSTFRNGVQAWSFAANATEQLYFEAQVPHGWSIGSEIRPHIHWSPGNSTDTGSVVWQLEYTWQNAGNEVFPTTTTLSVTDAAAGVAYAHQIAGFGGVSAAGKRESSIFVCRIARVGGDAADTFTGAAFGISVDFHYLATALGSVDEIPSIET